MGSGKRIAGLLLCLLMCAAVLTACAKNEPEPVEITLIHGWGSTESDHVAMRSIYQDFEKENPDVRLRMLSMPDSGEVVRKAEDMIMTGEIPDVIFFSGVGRETLYQYMVDHDLALDVMPYLEADEAFADSIAPDNLRYWQDDEGRLFSVSDVMGGRARQRHHAPAGTGGGVSLYRRSHADGQRRPFRGRHTPR